MKTYSTPSITELGSFHNLTLGGQDGNFLDAGFPANTPRGDLTFS